MKRSTKSISSLLIVALLGLMSMNMVACSNNDSNSNAMGPQPNPVQAISGVYESNYRWGGASGSWHGPVTLTINVDGTVYYGMTQIVNPTFGPNTLSWLIADGNKNQAAVVFTDSDDNSYFWADKGTVNERNFTGWVQNPGEGKLDYRGLIK
jgi:hypothetical protein